MKEPLPDNIISKMDPKDRPKGWMSGEDAQRKYKQGQEKQLHDDIITWLDRENFYFQHDRMDKRTTGEAGRPDFAICVAGRFLAIECKCNGEMPSPLQKARLALCGANKGHVVIAYDLKTVIAAIRRVEQQAWLEENLSAKLLPATIAKSDPKPLPTTDKDGKF